MRETVIAFKLALGGERKMQMKLGNFIYFAKQKNNETNNFIFWLKTNCKPIKKNVLQK